MNTAVVDAVNCGFAWLVAALSVAGYFVTQKRGGQRWPLWVVLATGWALLAIANTLLAMGITMRWSEVVAIWLASYVLVMASLALLFLKVVELRKRARG